MHHQLGAHEVMEAHEVLTDTIDGINQFMLYRPHVRDQQLSRILDKQIGFMEQEYQNMVALLSQQRGVSAEPYHSRINPSVKYGLRNPSPVTPHESARELTDRDVASGMLGCAKSSAILRMSAGLECADPQFRRMIIQGSVSSAEMAYETFSFMNERGMYQVPTMPMRTESNFMGTYQTGNITGQAMTTQNPDYMT
ncbi:MAG: spore coat protein [Bacillota bacterium]